MPIQLNQAGVLQEIAAPPGTPQELCVASPLAYLDIPRPINTFIKNLCASATLREVFNSFLAQSRRGAEQNLMIRI